MSRSLLAAVAAIAVAYMPAGESLDQGVPAAAVSAFAAGAQTTFAGEVAPRSAEAEREAASYRALLDRYCVTCHNERLVTGSGGAPSPLVSQLRAVGLTLDTLELTTVGEHPEAWERVVRKLRGGMMPPAGRPRPDEAGTLEFVAWLETELDSASAARPDPGRTAPLHRLNRAEYRNAVRDLLALEVDVDALLPADDSSYGFDNIGTALRMSQSLLERYLAAARTVSRLAVGSPPPAVVGETYRLATDMQQHDRMDRLPFGTRGGALVTHLFPQEAEYDIQVENHSYNETSFVAIYNTWDDVTTLSIRISRVLDARLNEESRIASQPKSLLARKALEQFLARQHRERFLAQLARAATVIDGDDASALAVEALPLDNESLALTERRDTAGQRRGQDDES